MAMQLCQADDRTHPTAPRHCADACNRLDELREQNPSFDPQYLLDVGDEILTLFHPGIEDEVLGGNVDLANPFAFELQSKCFPALRHVDQGAGPELLVRAVRNVTPHTAAVTACSNL